jgi:Collagen triple helix repeat (20 copies)
VRRIALIAVALVALAAPSAANAQQHHSHHLLVKTSRVEQHGSAKVIVRCYEETSKHKLYRVHCPATKKGKTGSSGLNGANGINGTNGASGSQGPSGIAGPAGVAGPKGEVGASGEKGETGTSGTPGEPGSKGEPGTPGEQGPNGNEGPAGATGPAGTNDPFVFGSYSNPVDLDSGICGNNWATDNLSRTYKVEPQSDGSFNVNLVVKGTFTTIIGEDEPGNCSQQYATEVKGTLYGIEAFHVSAPADFNPEAIIPSTATTLTEGNEQFFGGFFNKTDGYVEGSNYSWEFYYTAEDSSKWADTDHGTPGNIE